MTTALLVIDVQNDVLAGVDSASETVGVIAQAVNAARDVGGATRCAHGGR